MQTIAFKRFLKSHDIIVGVFVDVAGGTVVVHGEPEKLESDGLLKYYFTDAMKLDAHLTDRILPQMLQQGRVAGVLTRPTTDVIVGLLYHDERPVLQRYQHCGFLDQALRDFWTKDSTAGRKPTKRGETRR